MNPSEEQRDVPGSRKPDSNPKPGTVDHFYDTTFGEILLWAGALGAPILWAIQFQTNYTLVEWACRGNHRLALEWINLIFLLAALLMGVLSWLNWVRIGAWWPRSDDEGIRARTRLLAVIGLLSTGLFALLIFAQGIPNFIFNPCEL